MSRTRILSTLITAALAIGLTIAPSAAALPDSPAPLVVTPGSNGSFNMAWLRPANTYGDTIAGYQVQIRDPQGFNQRPGRMSRAQNASQWSSLPALLPPDQTSFNWSGDLTANLLDLVPGRTYEVRVGAVLNDAISEIEIGRDLQCNLRQNGVVDCRGYNTFGGLGFIPNSPQSPLANTYPGTATDAPVMIDGIYPGGRVGIATTLDVGDNFACVINIEGEVWCWGANNWGQLGDGSQQGSPRPVQVNLGNEIAATLALGRSTACVTTASKKIFCWGSDDAEALGNGRFQAGSRMFSATPIEVQVDTNGRATAFDKVVAGTDHQFCAIGRLTERRPDGRLQDKKLHCWGSTLGMPFNRIGFPTLGVARQTELNPRVGEDIEVMSASASYENVSFNHLGGCAVVVEGVVTFFCWSTTNNGRAILKAFSPGFSNVYGMATSNRETCAIVRVNTNDANTQVSCFSISTVRDNAIVPAYVVRRDLSDNLFRSALQLPSGAAAQGSPASALNPVALDFRRNEHCVAFSGSRAVCWGSNVGGLADQVGTKPIPTDGYQHLGLNADGVTFSYIGFETPEQINTNRLPATWATQTFTYTAAPLPLAGPPVFTARAVRDAAGNLVPEVLISVLRNRTSISESRPVTGYNYQFSKDDGATWGAVMTWDAPNAGSTASTFTTTTGFAIGDQLRVRVQERNAAGLSAWSPQSGLQPVYTQPGPVVDLRLSATADTAMRADWKQPTYNGGLPDVQYIVTVKNADGSVLHTQETTSTSYARSGLVNGAKYTVTVTTTNFSHAARANSSSLQAVTLPFTMARAPEAPTKLTVTSVNETTAKVTWTAPVTRGTPVTGYRVRVNTDGVWSGLPNIGTVVETTFSGVVGKKYRLQFIPMSAAGDGTPGQTDFFVFRPGNLENGGGLVTPPAAPTDFRVNVGAVTAQGIPVQFDIPDDGGAQVVSARFYYSSDNGTSWFDVPRAEELVLTPNSGSAVITGLATGLNYTLGVTISNVFGTSPRATVRHNYVLPPSAPRSLVVAVKVGPLIREDHRMRVSWVAPENLGGLPLTEYRVELSSDLRVWERVGTTLETNFWVDDLIRGAWYFVRVSAVTAAGQSAYSNVGQLGLPAMVPDRPTQVSVLAEFATLNSITVAFKEPADNGGVVVSGYLFTLTGPDGVVTTTSIPAELLTGFPGGLFLAEIPNLKPATRYTMQIRAVNLLGASIPTDPVEAGTALVPVPPAADEDRAGEEIDEDVALQRLRAIEAEARERAAQTQTIVDELKAEIATTERKLAEAQLANRAAEVAELTARLTELRTSLAIAERDALLAAAERDAARNAADVQEANNAVDDANDAAQDAVRAEEAAANAEQVADGVAGGAAAGGGGGGGGVIPAPAPAGGGGGGGAAAGGGGAVPVAGAAGGGGAAAPADQAALDAAAQAAAKAKEEAAIAAAKLAEEKRLAAEAAIAKAQQSAIEARSSADKAAVVVTLQEPVKLVIQPVAIPDLVLANRDAKALKSTPNTDVVATGVALKAAYRKAFPKGVKIQFAALSAKLTPASVTALQKLAKLPIKSVRITGYVQQSKSTANDKTLSLARANAVAKVLTGAGVRKGIVKTIAGGIGGKSKGNRAAIIAIS